MCFCAADIVGHADISAMVRQHPRQSGVIVSGWVDVAMMQTWLHGETGSGVNFGCGVSGDGAMEMVLVLRLFRCGSRLIIRAGNSVVI